MTKQQMIDLRDMLAKYRRNADNEGWDYLLASIDLQVDSLDIQIAKYDDQNLLDTEIQAITDFYYQTMDAMKPHDNPHEYYHRPEVQAASSGIHKMRKWLNHR